MKKGIYPGTFDPITCGHIDLIKKSLNIFDQIIVAISDGNSKNYLFTAEERQDLIKLALFKNKNLIQHAIISDLTEAKLYNFCGEKKIKSSIFSSVRALSNKDKKIIKIYGGFLINKNTPIPIKSNYQSNIGTDRISAVVAASYLYPNRNIWVFDAGTCLTADYIDKNKKKETAYDSNYHINNPLFR